MSKELALLELRNAICDKEWVNACANMETARGGWTSDWYKDMQVANAVVIECLKKVRSAS
jgi:hypothetical protein